MEIKNLSDGGFAANCYLISKGRDALLIDATADPDTLERLLAARGLTLRAILLTHGHFDHILTADRLRDRFSVPLLIHKKDADMLHDGRKNGSLYFFTDPILARNADGFFEGGDTLCFGELCLEVLSTPGHTAGSAVFAAKDALFTGDTLFSDCHGRTDLYSADPDEMVASLCRLALLDGDLPIYPGHGEGNILSRAVLPLISPI